MNGENSYKKDLLVKELGYCTALLESACIPLLVIDGESFLFVDCNQAALNIYQLNNLEQIIGKSPLVVSAEFQADGEPSAGKVDYYINEVLQKGEVVFEWLHKRMNNEEWLAEVHLKVFMHDNKKLIQCYLIDITQRKAIEEKNIQMKNMLQAILSATDDGILATSSAGTLLFSNSKFKEMWQIPQELVDLADDSILLKYVRQQLKEPDVFMATIKELYRDDSEETSIIEFLDGRVFERYSQPLMENNMVIGRLYSFRDITIKTELQQQLLSSENRMRTYIEKAPIAVLVIDRSGKYVEVNQRAIELTGYEREELLNMKVGDLNDDQDVETANEKLAELVETGVVEGEMLFIKKNGEKFWGYLYASIVSEQECIGFLTDITNDKKSEQEMLELRDKAISAANTKSNFLAVMSHEIRTPMNTIIGMGELLSETELSADQKTYIDIFNRSGNNLLRIINDILDISKLEAGKIEIEHSQFNLARLFNELARMYKLQKGKQEQDVVFIASIDKQIDVDVLGDSVRIYQVISNLLSNAFKFTKHGSVKLDVKCVAKSTKSISVICLVEDTGIGIAPEHTDKIFDMFSQADSSTTRKYGGTGLGLSIVRLIAEKMGANIELSSQEGIGSKFTFAFTLSIIEKANKIEVENDKVYANEQIQKKEKYRILLAEDSIDNQFLVIAFLKNEPFVIDIANNGLEAVVMHKENLYDLILMDVEMPEKDGLEATLEIRKWEKENKIDAVPICTLTAHVMNEQRELMVEAGVNEYMTKPIGKHDLINMVHKNLNK